MRDLFFLGRLDDWGVRFLALIWPQLEINLFSGLKCTPTCYFLLVLNLYQTVVCQVKILYTYMFSWLTKYRGDCYGAMDEFYC